MPGDTTVVREVAVEQPRYGWFAETVIVAAFFSAATLALKLARIPFAANIAVVATCGLVFLVLSRRSNALGYLGLTRPDNWIKFLLLVVAAVASTAVLVIVIMPLVTQFTGPLQSSLDERIFSSSASFITFLVLVGWGAAAFGEEILFRGFLLNHLARVFGANTIGWISAVGLQAVLFGLCHFQQGTAGIVLTGLVGLSFGVFYLLAGRNLWCVILAHGIIETISLVQHYQGA